jgi:hypothetical protein
MGQFCLVLLEILSWLFSGNMQRGIFLCKVCPTIPLSRCKRGGYQCERSRKQLQMENCLKYLEVVQLPASAVSHSPNSIVDQRLTVITYKQRSRASPSTTFHLSCQSTHKASFQQRCTGRLRQGNGGLFPIKNGQQHAHEDSITAKQNAKRAFRVHIIYTRSTQCNSISS